MKCKLLKYANLSCNIQHFVLDICFIERNGFESDGKVKSSKSTNDSINLHF